MSNFSQQRIDQLEDQISDGLNQVEIRLDSVLSDNRGVLDDIVGHLARGWWQADASCAGTIVLLPW